MLQLQKNGIALMEPRYNVLILLRPYRFYRCLPALQVESLLWVQVRGVVALAAKFRCHGRCCASRATWVPL